MRKIEFFHLVNVGMSWYRSLKLKTDKRCQIRIRIQRVEKRTKVTFMEKSFFFNLTKKCDGNFRWKKEFKDTSQLSCHLSHDCYFRLIRLRLAMMKELPRKLQPTLPRLLQPSKLPMLIFRRT